MSVLSKSLILALGISVGGCSHFAQNNPSAEYPIAKQFPQIYQGKLRSAAHWQVIAKEEANLLAQALPGSLVGFSRDPVFESPATSDFAIAYHHMLTEEMLANGLSVKDKAGDLDLSYHIQVVQHSDRLQAPVAPGMWTGLTTAGYVIAQAIDDWSNPELLTIPLAVALDIYNYTNADSQFWRTINTEVVLTTAARQDDQILYSNTSVYYFHSSDRSLYDGGASFGVVQANGGASR